MKLLVISFLSITLISCNSKPNGDFNKKKTETEVRQLLTDYFEEIRINGLSAEFKYLDSSEDFYWIPPGYNKALNYHEVSVAINANAAGLKSVNNRWETLKVYALTDKIATYNGIVVSEYTDTTGKTGISRLMEAGTVIHRPDGWKLLSGHTAVLP